MTTRARSVARPIALQNIAQIFSADEYFAAADRIRRRRRNPHESRISCARSFPLAIAQRDARTTARHDEAAVRRHFFTGTKFFAGSASENAREHRFRIKSERISEK